MCSAHSLPLPAGLAACDDLAVLINLYLAGESRLGIAILLAGADGVHGLLERGARIDGTSWRDADTIGPAEAVAMAVGVFGEAEPHAIERDVVLEGGVAQRGARLDLYRPVLVNECDLRHGCTSCLYASVR